MAHKGQYNLFFVIDLDCIKNLSRFFFQMYIYFTSSMF